MSVHECQEFEEFSAFKGAWANNPDSQFSYRVKKSDSTRNTMACAHADCRPRFSAGKAWRNLEILFHTT